MQGANRNIQQDNKERPKSFMSKCVDIGFWGGLIMSTIGYAAYLLNFTDFGPALIFTPLGVSWQDDALGQVAGIVAIALLSILVALVYKMFFATWYTMWVGAIYGVVIWLCVFFLLNPLFPELGPVTEFDQNTFVTTICLYILYGVFTGYSICFEYNEFNTPPENNINQS